MRRLLIVLLALALAVSVVTPAKANVPGPHRPSPKLYDYVVHAILPAHAVIKVVQAYGTMWLQLRLRRFTYRCQNITSYYAPPEIYLTSCLHR